MTPDTESERPALSDDVAVEEYAHSLAEELRDRESRERAVILRLRAYIDRDQDPIAEV